MKTAFGRSAIVGCLAVWTATASAHMVWIETERAEKGLLVRAGFGEAETWDPDLVETIEDSRFWTRTGEKFEPLSPAIDPQEKEFRMTISGPVPNAILAATDYGVIRFGKSPASWLRYGSKHLTENARQWNDQTPLQELRIELMAQFDGDAVKLQALFLGKPLANAIIKGRGPGGEICELKTDAEGRARRPISGAGLYWCYVGTTTEIAGEWKGKKYQALKDYAALSYRITDN